MVCGPGPAVRVRFVPAVGAGVPSVPTSPLHGQLLLWNRALGMLSHIPACVHVNFSVQYQCIAPPFLL
jgi:hypothetical protein